MIAPPKSNLQLFLTRRCQLSCVYCLIDKRDDDMTPRVLRGAIDLLMSHKSRRVRLDFTGGDPLVREDLLRRAFELADEQAARKGKELTFYLVTNGMSLSERAIEWLSRYRGRLTLQLSLDGNAATYNAQRPPWRGAGDGYKAARKALERLKARGLPFSVVQVVMPESAPDLLRNFDHLYELGAREVDINYALARVWSEESQRAFLGQLEGLTRSYEKELSTRRLRLGNLEGRCEPAALNSELMVETDGSLHLLTEWLFETIRADGKSPLRLGTVFDAGDINRLYWSPFHAHYTLARLYEGNADVRRTMLNNIAFGLKVGEFFRAVGGRVHAGARA